MRIVRDLSSLPADLRHGAITIGNFDGVHRGHARIVAELLQQASAVQGPAVVFTFDPHPVRLLRPEVAPPPLTWTERKAELLEELGVDAMIAYPTDEALLSLSPTDFFSQIVRASLSARAMVEGPNFCFGRQRAGDIQLLRELCDQSQIGLTIVEPLRADGGYISSSRVRELIRLGNVRDARQMMTRPYRIRGVVTHGAARGARLGFPTANIEGIDTLRPGAGVYAGQGIVDGTAWPAAIHLGPIPTFGDSTPKVEVHLLDFHGTLYGQLMEVDFLERLRDIRPFASVEELKMQLARDIEAARLVASQPRNE